MFRVKNIRPDTTNDLFRNRYCHSILYLYIYIWLLFFSYNLRSPHTDWKMWSTRVLRSLGTTGAATAKTWTTSNVLSIPLIQYDLGIGQPVLTTLQPPPSCYHPSSSYSTRALPPSSRSPIIVSHRNLSTEMPLLSEEKAKFTPPDDLGTKVDMFCTCSIPYCNDIR